MVWQHKFNERYTNGIAFGAKDCRARVDADAQYAVTWSRCLYVRVCIISTEWIGIQT